MLLNHVRDGLYEFFGGEVFGSLEERREVGGGAVQALFGREVSQSLPRQELGWGGTAGEIQHQFGSYVAAVFPPEGAIAVNELFELHRFIELAIIAGLGILIAPDLHEFLVAPEFLEHLRAVLLVAEVLPEGEADAPADLLVVLGGEVVPVLDGAAEGVLHGVAVGQVEHVVDGQSGGAFPAQPHREVALVVVEGRDFLPEEVGDVPGNVGTAPVLAAVHEDALLLGVRVQVDEHEAALLLEDGPLGEVDLRTAAFVVAVPDSVQVVPGEAAAVVAVDDSIWVEHGHYLEDEVVAQSLGLFAAGEEEGDESLADEGGWSFSRVHSAGDEDGPLLFGALEVGDSEELYVVAARRFCQCFPLEDGVVVAIVGEVEQVFVEHGEGVRRTVGEVGDIVFPLKIVGKR